MSTPVASTRVWHNGTPFDVSTINRESSSPWAYGEIYAETMVFYVGPDGKRGGILFQDEAARDCITVHVEIVKRIHETGSPNLTGEAA